ncbi:MAG: DUF4157 domain-containing protein [Anaerolineae bacterium]
MVKDEIGHLMKRLILLLLLALLPLSHGQAQEDTTISPALLEEIESIESQVEAIRGLSQLTPVIRRFPTVEEARAFIAELYERELTDEIVFEVEQFYRAFEFIPADFDYFDFFIELQQSQVAGFYYFDTQEMNTLLLSGQPLGDSLPAFEQITYAHEYTHALQDQHFDADTLLNSIEDTDAAMAGLALVEGDATYVMQLYTADLIERRPGVVFQILGLSLSGTGEMPENTPPVIEAELLMPYLSGLNFVTALVNEGGYALVNEAFTSRLPQSTEHILHPQTYLSGDNPVEVTLKPMDEIFGADWVMAGESTLGEWYLGQYLSGQISQREAETAAAGWGGDRYRIYYNANADEQAWVLKVAWDSPDELGEFVEALDVFQSTRFPDAEVYNGEDGGTCYVDNAIGETLCWLGDGPQTLMLTYAPDFDTANNIILAQR